MADNLTSATSTVLTVVATTGERVRELPIQDGQLVFVHNRNRIAFDFKGKRTFYNQVEILATESDRSNIETPLDGYYFCVDSAIFYEYVNGEWIARTKNSEETVFIGNEYPTLGQLSGKLYVNTQAKEIAVWEEETSEYLIVSNHTEDATDEDIDNLFVGL